MGSSILSLVGLRPSKPPVAEVERPSIRTTEPSDRSAGDVNILGIAAVHTPVRIWAVQKDIDALEEKLADRREELLYLTKLEQISLEYQTLRETRQRERKGKSSLKLATGT